MQEQQTRQPESTPAESAETGALKRRYEDAYRVAHATVSFGNGIKIAGIVLAALILLGTLIAVGQFDSMIGGALLIPGILLAGFVGLLFYLLGVLVAAQGQTLLASLDSAVNSSPFLTNDQKAEILSLTTQRGLGEKARGLGEDARVYGHQVSSMVREFLKSHGPEASVHQPSQSAQGSSESTQRKGITLDDIQF